MMAGRRGTKRALPPTATSPHTLSMLRGRSRMKLPALRLRAAADVSEARATRRRACAPSRPVFMVGRDKPGQDDGRRGGRARSVTSGTNVSRETIVDVLVLLFSCY